MKREDLELLQALRNVANINDCLLSNKGIEIYNILQDKAEEENIVW